MVCSKSDDLESRKKSRQLKAYLHIQIYGTVFWKQQHSPLLQILLGTKISLVTARVFIFPPGHSSLDGRSDSPSLCEMPKAGPVSLLGVGEEEDECTTVRTQRSHTCQLHWVARALAACPLHSQHFIA